MGQVLTSDYNELYALHKTRPKPSNKLNRINWKKIYETIRQLKIVVLQQINDTFDTVDDKIFENHNMKEQALGIYYGKLDENRMRNGIGIQNYRYESLQNKNIQYLGQFSDNRPHGIGFAIFEDDSWYFGTWNRSRVHPYDEQGELSKFGAFHRSNGDLFYGNWEERKLKKGYAQTLQYCYYGEFKNGLQDGFGHCRYYDGTIYSGYWKQGFMEGEGILWYQDRNQYIGTFKQSQKSGFGYEKKQNSEYFGYFQNNKNHGLGTKQMNDEISEGTWIQGELEGLYSKQHKKESKKWYIKANGQIQYLDKIEEQGSILELHGRSQEFEQNKIKLNEMYTKLIDKTKVMKAQCTEFKEFYEGYRDIMQDWEKLNELQIWIQQYQQR